MVVVAFSFARSRFVWLGLLLCWLLCWLLVCNFVMSHFNVMLLKSQECMYVYVSIVVPIYICMYACMRVCMYACMYVCMHA